MELSSSLLLFFCGLIILILSSNFLIHTAVKLSLLLRLTPLFIGAVLIAAGTSAPEIGVGVMAAIRDQKAIALGNILGSNIANIGLVLGLCALLRPLTVANGIFKREIPFLFSSVILFYILSLDLLLSRIDGLILIAFFILFSVRAYLDARKSFNPEEIEGFRIQKTIAGIRSYPPVVLLLLLFLAGVVFGADLMVKGGASLAGELGLSPWLLGITIFAVGTSLPELATSLTASFKKVHSIGVGNIIGSNICNIFFGLGVIALIRPMRLDPGILRFEAPVLIVFTLFLFTLMRTRYKITRLEGLVMFSGYLFFLLALILRRL